MPYFGLLSFLRKEDKMKSYTITTFQCPTSGFFLFYDNRCISYWYIVFCFNALLRASSFSTRFFQIYKHGYRIVSMPYFGLLPFLREFYVNKKQQISCFNALLRASSFSTSFLKFQMLIWMCFNALLRASSFSTLDTIAMEKNQ